MTLRCLAALALVPILGTQIVAQTGPNIQQPPYKNELLDNLAGFWSITGMQGNRPVHGVAEAEWVMGLYLRLHQKMADGPESVIHIGYDTYDRRLVAFRLDSISVRGAETPGYGLQEGNSIKFTYDYATLSFRDTWTWDPQVKVWQFLTESKSRREKEAIWRAVSNLTLRRGPGRGGPPGARPQAPRPPPAPVPPQ
jgi:hypothetical protein